MQTHFDVPRSPTVDRTAFILERCAGRRVLHLGCTDWPLTEERFAEGTLLHQRLTTSAASVVGLDADAEGVAYFNQHGLAPCVCGNVETASLEPLGGTPFDVIVAGEIIEHLENPGLFLRACKPLLAPGGILLITTINAYCLFRSLRYLLGRELVHEDHNYYYSPRVLEKLVSRCGYRVDEMLFHGTGREQHFVPWHYRLLMKLTSSTLPRLSNGVIAVARSSKPEA